MSTIWDWLGTAAFVLGLGVLFMLAVELFVWIVAISYVGFAWLSELLKRKP